MDNKKLEELFYKRLNSFSEEELISRLENTTPTGLGDIICESSEFEYFPVEISSMQMNILNPIHKVKDKLPRANKSYEFGMSRSSAWVERFGYNVLEDCEAA